MIGGFAMAPFRILLIFAVMVASAPSQATHAIRGAVADNGGGVIPGVTVTVTSADRTASVVTNTQGRYEITGLAEGTWRVSPKLAGFYVIDRDVTIHGRDEIVDFSLRVGGPPAPTNDPRRLALEVAEATWKGRSLRNYEFRIAVSCFCGIPSVRPWLRVVNGVPVTPEGVDDMTRGFFRHYDTAEKLFAAIRGALDSGGDVVDVRYDADTGFPLEATLDPQFRTSDDELYFSVEFKR